MMRPNLFQCQEPCSHWLAAAGSAPLLLQAALNISPGCGGNSPCVVSDSTSHQPLLSPQNLWLGSGGQEVFKVMQQPSELLVRFLKPGLEKQGRNVDMNLGAEGLQPPVFVKVTESSSHRG